MTQLLDHRMVLVSARRVAEMYGVPKRSVHYALKRGLIRGQLVSGAWLVDMRDLPDAFPVRLKTTTRIGRAE